MTNKLRKATQRQEYHRLFQRVKHNHGGRWIRRKEESALGSTARRGA